MIFHAYSDTTTGLMGLSVRSAGHIFAHRGRRISRPNGREDWLLFYVAAGSEHFSLTQEVDAKEGSFVLFRPGERQEHICLDEHVSEFYYIHFDAPVDFDPIGLKSFALYDGKPSAAVRSLFEQVIGELQARQACYAQLAVAGLLHILSLLARGAAELSEPQGRYAGQIAFVLQRINMAYDKGDTLADYAALCNMSKFHFVRVFKAITGCTPVQYKNKVRLEHAKDLLEDLSIPIGEVGERVGYASSPYFCDSFKRSTGMSPQAYRAQLKNEKRQI